MSTACTLSSAWAAKLVFLPTTHVELFSGVDAPSKEALFPTFQAGGSGWAGKTEEQNNAMLIDKGLGHTSMSVGE
jgi:hypothetical protein